MKTTYAYAILLGSITMSGCNSLPIQTNPEIAAATKALADQTASLQAAAKVEADNKATVRRDEAIRLWIAVGDDPNGINLRLC